MIAFRGLGHKKMRRRCPIGRSAPVWVNRQEPANEGSPGNNSADADHRVATLAIFLGSSWAIGRYQSVMSPGTATTWTGRNESMTSEEP